MTRAARLSHVRSTNWVTKFEGKNIVKGYRNWFAVDALCAILELRTLGVAIGTEVELRVKHAIASLAESRKREKANREEKEFEDLHSDSDDTFAYIAGRTPGGAPYGTTWEEIGQQPPWITDKIQ